MKGAKKYILLTDPDIICLAIISYLPVARETCRSSDDAVEHTSTVSFQKQETFSGNERSDSEVQMRKRGQDDAHAG